jgi:hypothetical protein
MLLNINMLKNFYEEKAVKKLMNKGHNPNFKEHQIPINSRVLIIGPSGSGKTNALMNLLNMMTETFQKIILVTSQPDEPLYQHLQNSIPPESMDIYTNIDAMPWLDKVEKDDKEQYLVIFDDQISDPKINRNAKLIEYVIRSRKKNFTQIFISQSFVNIPILLRKQMTVLMMLKMPDNKEIKRILSQYTLGLDVDELFELYKMSAEGMNFFKIDVISSDPNHKYSLNFNNYYRIEN